MEQENTAACPMCEGELSMKREFSNRIMWWYYYIENSTAKIREVWYG
jgi:hypothetical protein